MDATDLQRLALDVHLISRTGPTCQVGKVITWVRENEEVEVVEALVRAIDNPQIQARVLCDYLAANGYDIAPPTLRRHRRRLTGEGCRCDK